MASFAKTVTRTAVLAVALGVCSAFAVAGPLDEMAIDRWAKLKEAERFQLTAAERLYKDSQWKAAADEYEKFLKLYEKSEGAAFAQLKWSHCQVHLRKQNAAIKDGYQSLLDYYPESPEAPLAGLLIGRTYRDMGDSKPAKKAYAKLISTYPKHYAAVMARLDLVDIAAKEKDDATRTNLLRELTFDVKREGPAIEPCVAAARLYCHVAFLAGNFDEGLKALATTCTEADVPLHLMHPSLGRLPTIVAELTANMDEATKKLGEKLADAGTAWLKTQVAANLKDAKTKPQAVAAWYFVADLRHAARQPDKQKVVYDEMLAALGAEDTTLGHLAQWYKESGQRELARATYAKFKDVNKGQVQIAQSFTEPKEVPPQPDKAVEIYRKLALADAKTAPDFLNAAALVYRRASKPDLAIAIYQELIQTDIKNAASYPGAIAYTLYEAHRWKDCIDKYRPLGYSLHNNQHMAAAHRQLKQYDEAISMYRQIIAASSKEQDKQAAAALLAVAVTQEEAGKKEDAIATFKQVCDKFPKTSEGSVAHTTLNDKYKIPVTLGGAKD